MVICCANQKGRVGKTTSALNLAICLARPGCPVLAVDCDPQATMTRQLGIDARVGRLTLVDVCWQDAPPPATRS
jgi:chromosome partitioning protein